MLFHIFFWEKRLLMSVKGMVDLHFHTECSGDSFMPLYSIIPAAERLGLAAIAKTDHDSVTGCDVLMETARHSRVEYIPGVELSTSEGYHILGFYIDPENEALAANCEREKAYGREQLKYSLQYWQNHGGPYDGDLEPVMAAAKALRPGGEISLKQVALVFTGMGVFASPDEARIDYESRTGDLLPPSDYQTLSNHQPPTAEEAIKLIRGAGGLAVIAHPKKDAKKGASRPNLEEVIRLVEAGAVGVECYNIKVMNAEERDFWEKACIERNLARTGGTDWHECVEHWNVTRPTVAPYDCVRELKERRQ